MPKFDKKWDSSAERDLTIAVLMGNSEVDRVRYNWPKTHEIMQKLGYGFSKDAMSQHFTKVIMKDFKSRNGEILGVAAPDKSSAKSTPCSGAKKRGRAGDTATPTPMPRKKRAPSEDHHDDDESGEDKKQVKSETAPVKSRQESTIVDDQFDDWLAEGAA